MFSLRKAGKVQTKKQKKKNKKTPPFLKNPSKKGKVLPIN